MPLNVNPRERDISKIFRNISFANSKMTKEIESNSASNGIENSKILDTNICQYTVEVDRIFRIK